MLAGLFGRAAQNLPSAAENACAKLSQKAKYFENGFEVLAVVPDSINTKMLNAESFLGAFEYTF